MIKLRQKQDPRPEILDPQNPDPLLGFIALDDTTKAFKEYIWKESGNSYESSGSSKKTFGENPRRGNWYLSSP